MKAGTLCDGSVPGVITLSVTRAGSVEIGPGLRVGWHMSYKLYTCGRTKTEIDDSDP